MATSLRSDWPLTSNKSKLTKSIEGGALKITQLSLVEQPLLAKKSTHLFASLKIWTTRAYVSLDKRDLQSCNRGECFLLEQSVLLSITTITLASSSTSRKFIPNWMAKYRPFLNTHNSAITLVVNPIGLEKPLIQFPWLFLIRPPPPDLPGLPRDAPSVFNLCQPDEGLVQLTEMATLDANFLTLLTQ